MRYLFTFLVFIVPVLLISQPEGANYFEYNPNQQPGIFSDHTDREEVAFLYPDAPGKLEKIYVRLFGQEAKRDTIRITGDPSDGLYAPSLWVNGVLNYNLHAQFIINHDGENGTWYELDVSELDLYIGGINRIGVSHLIKQNGPYFGIDQAESGKPFSSWLMKTFEENPDFHNIIGTFHSYLGGEFQIAAKIDWTYGSEDAQPPAPQLVDVTKEAGLTDGSGNPVKDNTAAIYDWNGDGFEDVFVGNRFFENNGDGTFTDVSDDFSNIKRGKIIFGDIDNDGFVDIYSANGNDEDLIYYGSENGFVEETDIVLKYDDRPSTAPILIDYNNDGLLDVFIARGRRTVDGKEVYYQDQLFKNLGNREFEDVTTEAGFEEGEPNPNYDCYGANVCDFNQDGYPDIFVATYRLAPDLLYRNNGDGTFTEIGASSNVRGNATAVDGYFGHGMGSDWGDMNMDGEYDLTVGNLGHPDQRGAYSNPSLIFLNNGDETFNEVHQELGLKFFEMNASPLWIDLNNDGYLDIWSSQYSYQNISETSSEKYSRVYINQGPENDFKLMDKTWEFGSLIHGAWVTLRFDYDLDGDMDILACSNQENVKLFRNDLNEKGNAVTVRIKNDPETNNTHAYNAKLTKSNGDVLINYFQGINSSGRVSQNSEVMHFGLEDDTTETIEVNFNSGESFTFDARTNVHYEFTENGELTPLEDFKYIWPAESDSATLTINDELKWSPVINAEEYIIVIWDQHQDAVHKSIIKNGFQSSFKLKIAEEVLETGNRHYWDIAAVNRNGWVESPRIPFILKAPNSVEESISGLEAEIAPNPVTDNLNLNFTSEETKLYEFEIIDMSGKSVLNLGKKIIGGQTELRYNVSDLNNGIYLLKIISGDRYIVKKFSVNR